jgi:hypothetical protein
MTIQLHTGTGSDTLLNAIMVIVMHLKTFHRSFNCYCGGEVLSMVKGMWSNNLLRNIGVSIVIMITIQSLDKRMERPKILLGMVAGAEQWYGMRDEMLWLLCCSPLAGWRRTFGDKDRAGSV